MITVAICTANRKGLLSDLLAKLSNQIKINADYRILVVDSSSSIDQSLADATALYGKEQLIYLPGTTAGLSAARNIAISKCTTRYIAFIDDDAVPCEGWIDSILKTFHENGELCAAVGGKIIPLWQVKRPAWLSDKLLTYLSILDLGSRKRYLSAPESLYGANMAFRLSALKRVHGFRVDLGRRNNLLLSNEESELQKRLTGLGFKVSYSPDICVYHKIGQDRLMKKWFYDRIFWQAISDIVVESDDNIRAKRILDSFMERSECPEQLVNNEHESIKDPDKFFRVCESLYTEAREFALKQLENT